MTKMAAGCAIGGTTGTLIGGLMGGLSTAFSVASGATGAAVLDAAGHSGYAVAEAVEMGALGAAATTVPLFVAGGCIVGSCAGMFAGANNRGEDDKKNAGCGTFVANSILHVGLSTLVGMAGWAITNAGEAATEMSLGHAAAAFATGSAITMIPAGIVTACVVLPIALGAMACASAAANDNDNDTEMQNRSRVSRV